MVVRLSRVNTQESKRLHVHLFIVPILLRCDSKGDRLGKAVGEDTLIRIMYSLANTIMSPKESQYNDGDTSAVSEILYLKYRHK